MAKSKVSKNTDKQSLKVVLIAALLALLAVAGLSGYYYWKNKSDSTALAAGWSIVNRGGKVDSYACLSTYRPIGGSDDSYVKIKFLYVLNDGIGPLPTVGARSYNSRGQELGRTATQVAWFFKARKIGSISLPTKAVSAQEGIAPFNGRIGAGWSPYTYDKNIPNIQYKSVSSLDRCPI